MLLSLLVGCLWSEKTSFSDTDGQEDSQVVHHAILDQPLQVLALVGRAFICTANDDVLIYEIEQRDAPIFEGSYDLGGPCISLLNYGERLIFSSADEIQLLALGTLNQVDVWESEYSIIDATSLPGGTSLLALLDSTPPSVVEIEFGEGELNLVDEWVLDETEALIKLAAYQEGLVALDADGTLYHYTFDDVLTSVQVSIPPYFQDLHITDDPYILHSTGGNGLFVYDTSLNVRDVWPELGESRALTSVDSQVYVTVTEEFWVLEIDPTGLLSESWQTPLEPYEAPSMIYSDRGYAYSIDSELGHFSIIDTIR